MQDREIKRVGRHENMAVLHVWIPYSLSLEIDEVRRIISLSKGDTIAEALRYWLNAQYQMGVKRGQ